MLWQHQEQGDTATPAPACTRAGHLFGLQHRPSRSADEHLPSVAVPCLQPCQHPTGTSHHTQPCWGCGHIHPCSTKTSLEGFLPHCRFGIERGLHVCNCHLEDNQLKSGVLLKKKKRPTKNPNKSFECINYLIFQSVITFLMSSVWFFFLV